MSKEDAAETTAHAAGLSSHITTEESFPALAALCISSAVMADLLSPPGTNRLEIHESVADGGNVKIVGQLNSAELLEGKGIAEQAPG